VGVGLSEEGDRQRRCRFNDLVPAREGGREDKVLLDDEAEITSSS
jgi:hypothetical protein